LFDHPSFRGQPTRTIQWTDANLDDGRNNRMSLRLQLLTLGALTLLLPWAGLRMVQQVETSLRLALEGALLDSARAHVVATQLVDAMPSRVGERSWRGEPLYAHALSKPPLIDGFFGEWDYTRGASDESAVSSDLTFDNGTRLWLGADESFVYLFVDVVDDEVVFQSAPGETPHGDRVVILYGSNADSPNALLLVNSAPGGFRAQPTAGFPEFAPSGGYLDTARGVWQNTARGYAIEARVPVRLLGDSLGVGIIDSFDGGDSARLAAATWSGMPGPGPLIRERSDLNLKLRPFFGGDDRLRVIDGNGWVLADSGPLAPATAAERRDDASLVERLFRYVLRRDDPDYLLHEQTRSYISDPALRAVLDGTESTAWFRQGAAVSAIVVAAVPIDPANPGRGALLLEQASDPVRTVTNQAMLQVMSTTALIILITVPGLLAYAGFLSFRVGRLARAAESALGPRGEINVSLPGAKGRDEIGDLSRAFGDLLGRLRDYTDYLQSLKSKLSHELRTPLAIVATSLDNLEHEMHSASGKDYLGRLRHGAERLESILQAMTAATRVEQAINQADLERFDLAAVVASCVASYRDIYSGQSFESHLPDEPVLIDGSAELIEQMLDKLIDNAVGFANAGTAIEIDITAAATEVCLTVSNRGPLLPETMRHQLFDSLVSVRESKGDKPHLGLGLYIVTLVAELHRGHVDAANLDDGSGVRFSVVLPRADAGSA
jgi:dedicated sortase system histidine kinase